MSSKCIKNAFETAIVSLSKIENKIDRENFRKELLKAKSMNSYDKVCEVRENINKYNDINSILNVVPRIMTFEEATLEFIKTLCVDVASMPNLPEYYTDIEKDGVFPTTKSESERRKGVKREAISVNTIVKKNMIIASADTQSGKTNYTLALAIKSMLEGRTPIIVTRALTGDMNKFIGDIENVSIGFNKYMEDNNVVSKKFEITSVCGAKLSNETEIKLLEKSLSKVYPRIIVALGNASQLGKILNIIKENYSSYDLLIDEIDNVDYGTDTKTSLILNPLKECAYQVFGITATPLDAIFSEKDLKSANMIRLTKPNDYRGFVDFQVKLLEIDEKTNGLSKIKTFEEILESDGNLEPFLEWFSRRLPDWSWNSRKNYPRICLIKNSHIIENQNQMYEGILNRYSSKFVVIVYNGEGVRVNFQGMKPFGINGKEVIPNEYVEISIPEILQYLKDHGAEKKFPRIIIISGKLAGRCISYVSKDYDWHLTDMYYNPSKSTPIPEMIQSAGRLCGRNRGKAPNLILHTTKKVSEALYNGFHFTNEAIARAIASPLMLENGYEANFKESVCSIPMSNKKAPKARKLTSKVKSKKSDFNIVGKEDGGLSVDEYKYKKYEEESKSEHEKDKEDIKVSHEPDDELDKEEFNRLITMFGKWSKLDTKISKFMQHLNPTKTYSDKEMKELCKLVGITDISHLTIFKRNISKGYGKILQKKLNTYRLYPCLVDNFNKYF